MHVLHTQSALLYAVSCLVVNRYIAIRNDNCAKFVLLWSASPRNATELVGLADSMAVAVLYLGFRLQLDDLVLQAVCECTRCVARASSSVHQFSASHMRLHHLSELVM